MNKNNNRFMIDDWLKDSCSLYSQLNESLEALNFITDNIKSKIDLSRLPWYRNLVDLYIPDAIKYSIV